MKFTIHFIGSNDIKQCEEHLSESIRLAFNAAVIQTMLPCNDGCSLKMREQCSGSDTIVCYDNEIHWYATRNYEGKCTDVKTAYLKGGSVDLEMDIIKQKNLDLEFAKSEINKLSKLIRTNKGVSNFEVDIQSSSIYDKLQNAEFEEVWEYEDGSLTFSYFDLKLNFILRSPKYKQINF